MVEFISNWAISVIGHLGYFGVFILMGLESACIPIPSEVIMPFAGAAIILKPATHMSLLSVTLAGTLGCIAGSILAYFVGLKGGRPLLLKYGKYILITEQKLNYVDEFFKKHGEVAIFWSRVMPIVRTFISLPAGISKMNFPKFVIFSTLGSLPWCFALALVGDTLGKNWGKIRPWFHVLDGVVVVAIVGIIIYLFLKYKKSKEAKKRSQ